ncbi:MAG: metal-binding protein, partial [Methanobacterium sp.]|nr:metal-binding protein [Methanobacterium sp.]
MRKQGVILVIATLMAIILCGAVSATDSSTTGGESNISDVNSSETVDPILWVNVDYEYDDDNINPEITVTDSNNDSVTFDKTKYSDTLYKLNFTYAGVVNGTLFNVMISAPGYINQTKKVAVSQAGTDSEFVGSANFNMQATENYKLGREVTAAADKLLHFASADDVLCITTAGLAYRNGTTTEDCLEGVLNGSHGEISYGQGNLLTFQSIRTDPVDFCF